MLTLIIIAIATIQTGILAHGHLPTCLTIMISTWLFKEYVKYPRQNTDKWGALVK